MKNNHLKMSVTSCHISRQMGEAVASAAEASPPDPDIAEAAASALRAVVDKLADLDPSKVSGFCFEESRWGGGYS